MAERSKAQSRIQGERLQYWSSEIINIIYVFKTDLMYPLINFGPPGPFKIQQIHARTFLSKAPKINKLNMLDLYAIIWFILKKL